MGQKIILQNQLTQKLKEDRTAPDANELRARKDRATIKELVQVPNPP